ncbi:uncharacterized protein METZ01_LOCUS290492, partial [marine metagenome]
VYLVDTDPRDVPESYLHGRQVQIIYGSFLEGRFAFG